MTRNTQPDGTVELDAIVQETEAEAVARIARENLRHDIAPGLAVINGESFDYRLDLEWVQRSPTSPRGVFRFGAVHSFCDYVAAHSNPGDPDACTYISPNPGAERVAVCVLDDHHIGEPGWGRHVATLDLDLDPAFKAWRKADGVLMAQAEFAEFIEDHLPEITDPDGATLLEIVSTITASSSIQFLSAERLADGTRKFTWSEDQTATAGTAGELEIPEAFTIAAPVYLHSGPVTLTARLRYRIGQGGLRIGLKLDRPDDALLTARQEITDTIHANLGDRPIYVGVPATPGERAL